MTVKITLSPKDSKSLRQAFEDMPIDLCGFVDCPNNIQDDDSLSCDCCPFKEINDKYCNTKDELFALIKKLEE